MEISARKQTGTKTLYCLISLQGPILYLATPEMVEALIDGLKRLRSDLPLAY